MELNLISILKERLGGRITRDATKVVRMEPDEIELALDYVFPALLGKLISRVQSVEDARALRDYLKDHKYDGSILDEMEGAFDGGDATALILNVGKEATKYLVGSDLENYLKTISEFTKLDTRSILKLTYLVSPMFLSQMQFFIQQNNLKAPVIYKYISDQKDIVVRQTPSKLFDKLGLAKVLETAVEQEQKTQPEMTGKVKKVEEEEEGSFRKVFIRLIPQIIGLICLIIAFIYIQDYNEVLESDLGKLTDDELIDQAFSGKPILSWGLPNGTEVTAPKGTALDELMKFLYNPNNESISTQRFSLTMDIIDDERDTLRRNASIFTDKLSSIMKAYDGMSVRFNISIPHEMNVKTSQIGVYLKDALIEKGIDGNRITWQTSPRTSIGGGDIYSLDFMISKKTQESSKK